MPFKYLRRCSTHSVNTTRSGCSTRTNLLGWCSMVTSHYDDLLYKEPNGSMTHKTCYWNYLRIWPQVSYNDIFRRSLCGLAFVEVLRQSVKSSWRYVWRLLTTIANVIWWHRYSSLNDCATSSNQKQKMLVSFTCLLTRTHNKKDSFKEECRHETPCMIKPCHYTQVYSHFRATHTTLQS